MRRSIPAVLCTAALTSASPAASQEPDSTGSDWTDGGVCYEIFVRSFYDSDGDGIGDLEGLIRSSTT